MIFENMEKQNEYGMISHFQVSQVFKSFLYILKLDFDYPSYTKISRESINKFILNRNPATPVSYLFQD